MATFAATMQVPLHSLGVALLVLLLGPFATSAQYPGWQQAVDYTMDITVDAPVHQYSGVMDITYTNNSPDALDRIPFHLFFNAFQPGSMMDVRSRNIADPDRRVGDRILNLPAEEQGWLRVHTARVGKTTAEFSADGTIGWLTLPQTLAPGQETKVLGWGHAGDQQCDPLGRKCVENATP